MNPVYDISIRRLEAEINTKIDKWSKINENLNGGNENLNGGNENLNGGNENLNGGNGTLK